jgi:TetR/AcrR family transcriptional regulator, transcriptional repressor for nem operon
VRDTRADILLEAEALIRARGYSGVSYADLAGAVGIRKASIHHHFPTKADLALGLLRAYDARYDEALDAILVGSMDGLARLRAYAALYRDGVEKGLGCLCAAFAAELDTLPATLRDELARFLEKHVAWIEGVLASGLSNGTIRRSIEPRPCARMIVAALEGALMMERMLGGPVGFDDAFRAIESAVRPA